jgi:competence protein ComEA
LIKKASNFSTVLNYHRYRLTVIELSGRYMNKTWWYIAFIVVGVLCGAGILILVTRPPRGKAIILLPPPTPAPITVYVTGSVKQEGLYTLPPDSRLNDAIQAAGGFSEDADRGAINLAEVLQDGQQVTVPAMGEAQVGGNPARSMNGAGILVNINTATLAELDTLPQIGPVTAQSIIDYRQANGPFETIEDLLEVDGIGQATFDKVKDLVTVGTSP